MRTSKIAVIVAAAALLVLGTAFTSFAAKGWQEESGTWVYYDKNEELVTEDWAKSGAYWYWLDEDGYMATDKLIEDDDKYYYVDESGRMVTNQWRLLPKEDDDELFEDEIWYYFQASGKAYKAGESGITWKTINGKKYAFDDQARMLFGWIAEDGTMVDADEDLKYQEGVYFCGDNMDGHRRQNEWEQMYVDDGEGNDKNWWFYFGANGKKIVSNGNKGINGKKYAFADDGHMLSEWVEVASGATPNTANFRYFSSPEDGSKYTKGWFWVVPAEKLNQKDSEDYDDNTRWFYAKGNGTLYKSALKTINGKVYGFKDDGEMVSGLYWSEQDSDGNWSFSKISDQAVMEEYTDISKWNGAAPDPEAKSGLRFFGAEYPDGSLKTGNVTVSVDGDDYKMKFKTKGGSKGVGVHGKDGNNFYVNGLKITADEDQKYQLFPVSKGADDKDMITGAGENARAHVGTVAAESYVLLSKTGALIKNGTKTDADDYKIIVKGGYVKEVQKPKD